MIQRISYIVFWIDYISNVSKYLPVPLHWYYLNALLKLRSELQVRRGKNIQTEMFQIVLWQPPLIYDHVFI